jgi:Uma2 family endonuclease
MAAAAPRLHYTFREYVRFEADARERHEFVGGLILAMAGGTLEHARRCAKVIALLDSALSGRKCSVYDSNARIRVRVSGNAYYPDASVICGRLEVDPEDALSATNPTVLVEVLSESTAEYDRTDKLADYQSIPSLRHVVHVAHDTPRIDLWTRTDDGWRATTWSEGDQVPLDEIECRLDVSSIVRDPLA